MNEPTTTDHWLVHQPPEKRMAGAAAQQGWITLTETGVQLEWLTPGRAHTQTLDASTIRSVTFVESLGRLEFRRRAALAEPVAVDAGEYGGAILERYRQRFTPGAAVLSKKVGLHQMPLMPGHILGVLLLIAATAGLALTESTDSTYNGPAFGYVVWSLARAMGPTVSRAVALLLGLAGVYWLIHTIMRRPMCATLKVPPSPGQPSAPR